jgi:hypothetical protein
MLRGLVPTLFAALCYTACFISAEQYYRTRIGLNGGFPKFSYEGKVSFPHSGRIVTIVEPM